MLVGGDAVPGPFASETLDRLDALGVPALGARIIMTRIFEELACDRDGAVRSARRRSPIRSGG
ncbi:MAG: hypothetical protein ACRDLN_00370 [Solirubrobacteraceae bacterium]